MRSLRTITKSSPHSPQLEKARVQQQRPNAAKNKINKFFKDLYWDFPVGTVVKNPPAKAGDTGLSPGPGRFHMPQSN